MPNIFIILMPMGRPANSKVLCDDIILQGNAHHGVMEDHFIFILKILINVFSSCNKLFVDLEALIEL